MSHYRVLVCLKPGHDLAEALAPFDENIEALPADTVIVNVDVHI